MAELFISTNQSGLEIYPNPDLEPESGWSTEIGIKQGVRVGNWMGYLDVAAFLMQYDDMMELWKQYLNVKSYTTKTIGNSEQQTLINAFKSYETGDLFTDINKINDTIKFLNIFF